MTRPAPIGKGELSRDRRLRLARSAVSKDLDCMQNCQFVVLVDMTSGLDGVAAFRFK